MSTPFNLDDLNDEQRKAVEAGKGPLLVLAGAGSGKTRVLTHRIAYLLATKQAQTSEILAITFTNKAAAEMRERVEKLIGYMSRSMWVMTFHSACARILRSEADKLGYSRSFTIYDEADSRRLIRNILSELNIDQKRFPPRAIKAQISDAKSNVLDAKAYEEKVSGFFEQTTAEVYALYERRMHEADAMDFDDLLMRTIELFRMFDEVLDRYRKTFKWVLVDEYQDTNHAQYEFLMLLAGEHGNICVVGDDDQSIYRFRGADVGNILNFERDFPNCKTIKLERNYRSTQNILSAANAVVSNNNERMAKKLWTDEGAGDPINIVQLEDEHEEARFVAGEVEALSESGIARSEIAVFYRTNALSRVLEDTLVRYSIPYQVIGGTKFYERAEIKDALAYLTLIVNPNDPVAFSRVVNSPKRGVGATTQAKVMGYANTTGESPLVLCESPGQIPGVGKAAAKGLKAFSDLMSGLFELATNSSVEEVLLLTLERSGYLDDLQAQRTVEAQGRMENLQELVGVAAEYSENEEEASLQGFLEELALFSEQDSLRDDQGTVTLMTLHNAKGLEYQAVFIIGCEEGLFPHSRSIDEGSLDEERRLCYVGITRARSKLTLTYTRSRSLYGAREYNLPSTFLSEIPTELIYHEEEEESYSDGSGESLVATATSHVTFKPGDDVAHSKFGDGVVIDLEPGGVVVVRFAEDGIERKLMADYAPLLKK